MMKSATIRSCNGTGVQLGYSDKLIGEICHVPDMMGSFSDGATTSLVVKSLTKQPLLKFTISCHVEANLTMAILYFFVPYSPTILDKIIQTD